ncbi:unnamed protein product [Rotaria magnacalcarata]|uniref:Major facilitator superfamily (MFS) profile domain-containing protein n=1 Tax=Rotaria magnacalcarata TaxID=392030 RepID=A0A816D2S1_9BILA|nr:unnamed protein product [Rotaria magnacalcarata]CAF1631651.1 unnamed protein product [Rotaria magnacalcarata]CAF3774441.1 unnamed protein product [Rotaria magnacalcarata]CAF3802485.1 unnamed protein product [Rotaria magnacalcarata]
MILSTIYYQIPKRYILSILGFFGMLTASILRSNLSIAIVAMTTPTLEKSSINTTKILPADYNWSSTTQGYILSSLFYSYSAFQIPAGFLATIFGGRILFGGSIGLCALLTLLTPICARRGPGSLIYLRILEGLCSSCVYPSLYAVWSKWEPKNNKSALVTFSFSGAYFGTFIIMLLGGVIAADWSWEWIFYLSGMSALVWAVVWFLVTVESPSTYQNISDEEVIYIEEDMGKAISQNDTVPWKAIFTSLPVWAIIAAHFGTNWAIYTMFSELPTFVVESLDFPVDTAGLLSALPWLPLAISVYLAGIISDKLVEKYPTLYVRKLIMAISFTIIASSFLLIALLDASNRVLIVMGVIIVMGASGPAWASTGVNQLDIAGRYAAVLMGISNSIGSTPGFLAPMITGYIVENSHLKHEWNIIFIISIVICALALGCYLCFAAGELQPWALNNNDEYQAVLNYPVSSRDFSERSVLNANNNDHLTDRLIVE